ncbi:aspartic peptidase domain-containing protein [Xylaria sp. FL0043]|nr:aspartic peptidase domain-containing protein [Xylaria sp. FL0043]
MRASLLVVSLGTVTATPVVAQKVVSLPFSRAGPGHTSLRKRAGTYSQELNNNLTGGGYYAEVSLGTPPQPVTLILDTGSSDVWVLDSHADLCQDQELQYTYGTCLATYDPTSSSTYALVDPDGFSIQYLDSSGAEGDYIKDTFRIGGASIKALQVGLAENSTINSGLLGIGFNTNVAAVDPYHNIVDLFVDQKLIETQAYSLYLDDLFAETGTILFGGIDNKKFIGQLKSVDILRDARSKTYSSFTVALNSLTVSSGPKSGNTDFLGEETPVILDSGTTLTYLPPRVATQIYRRFNAVDDSLVTGLIFVDCGLLTSEKNTTLDFQFGGSDGPLIKVPIDELVLDNVKGYIALGLELPHLPFDDVCSFGIQGLRGVYLLGDTFLRSAYVVYDLNHKKIALAQANLNATGSNVMEISATSGIPLVKGVAAQETPTPTNGNSNDKNGLGSSGSSGTDAANESTSDSAAPRAMPALEWEAAAVMLVATFFCLAGAGLVGF